MPGAIKIVIAIVSLALAGLAWAQNASSISSTKTQKALKTFVSPDGAFQFTYPELLIHCEQKPQGSGEPYFWPQECSAYFPVCTDGQPAAQTTVACFAYPRNKFTDTRVFEAAAFSVSTAGGDKTENTCTKGSPDWQAGKAVTVQGIQFAAFETGDGGMSQQVTRSIYRTFHRGQCYQLEIAIATANAQVFDPPVREFSTQDRGEVNRRLEQALDSFRFLK